MFRITDDPSSGSLVHCLAKNYENNSVVSVDVDKVGVNGSMFLPVVRVCSSLSAFIYSELHTRTTGQNTPP